MASVEREVEKGLLNAVSGVTGLNRYTSERESPRLLPSLVAQARIGNELLGPFTGVFNVPATLTYTAKADTTTRTAFDAKFQSIVAQLYRDPDLPSYMTNVTSATIYQAKITSESPEIISRNRTWAKTISLDINATAIKASPPPPFSPSDISGLIARFNADFGISQAGGAITSWTDQENSILATAHNGPTLLSNQIDSRSAVSFNGANSYFLFSLPSPIPIGQKRTFVVIGKYNTPLETAQQGYLNTQADDQCYIFKNSGENKAYYYTEDRQLEGPNVGIDSYHIISVVHNGIPGANFIRINGITSTNVSYGTMDNLPEIQDFIIGGRSAANEIILGEIVELLIYNKELSSSEIAELETYASI